MLRSQWMASAILFGLALSLGCGQGAEALNEGKEVQYTSTLKQMQVMTERGFLSRNESQMTHIYSAVHPEESIREHFLGKFIDLFYKGSAGQLVLQLIGKKKISKEEVEYIKEQLKKIEK